MAQLHYQLHLCTWALCSPTQLLDAGPSSWTRGSIQCMPCHWSVESSTKLHCIGDTDLQLKPDVILLQLDDYGRMQSEFSWWNVASFLKLTSEDFSSHLHLQLTRKAYRILIAQPGQWFVISVLKWVGGSGKVGGAQCSCKANWQVIKMRELSRRGIEAWRES